MRLLVVFALLLFGLHVHAQLSTSTATRPVMKDSTPGACASPTETRARSTMFQTGDGRGAFRFSQVWLYRNAGMGSTSFNVELYEVANATVQTLLATTPLTGSGTGWQSANVAIGPFSGSRVFSLVVRYTSAAMTLGSVGFTNAFSTFLAGVSRNFSYFGIPNPAQTALGVNTGTPMQGFVNFASCVAPFLDVTMVEDSCQASSFGPTCQPCAVPANSTCLDGYFGSGGFICHTGFFRNSTLCSPCPLRANATGCNPVTGAPICAPEFRVSVLDPNACVPSVCVAPFTRNTTSDRCDACVVGARNGPQCANSVDLCRLPYQGTVFECEFGYYVTEPRYRCLEGFYQRDSLSPCETVLYTRHEQGETNFTSLLFNDAKACDRFIWFRLSSVTEVEANGTIVQTMNPRFNLTSCVRPNYHSSATPAITCTFHTSHQRFDPAGALYQFTVSIAPINTGVGQHLGMDGYAYFLELVWPYLSATSTLQYRLLVRTSNPLPAPVPVRTPVTSDFRELAVFNTSAYGVNPVVATYGDGRIGYNRDPFAENPVFPTGPEGNTILVYRTNMTDAAKSERGPFAAFAPGQPSGQPYFRLALIDPADRDKAALSASAPPTGARSYLYDPFHPRFSLPTQSCAAYVDMTIPGVAFNVTVPRNETSLPSSSSSTGGSAVSSTGSAEESAVSSTGSAEESSSSTAARAVSSTADELTLRESSSGSMRNETYVPPPATTEDSAGVNYMPLYIGLSSAVGAAGALSLLFYVLRVRSILPAKASTVYKPVLSNV